MKCTYSTTQFPCQQQLCYNWVGTKTLSLERPTYTFNPQNVHIPTINPRWRKSQPKLPAHLRLRRLNTTSACKQSPKKIPKLHLNSGSRLPVCISAAFRVNASRTTASLRPFTLAAKIRMLSSRPASRPPTVKAGILADTFACMTPVCWSNTSMANHCRWPPSKPAATPRKTAAAE